MTLTVHDNKNSGLVIKGSSFSKNIYFGPIISISNKLCNCIEFILIFSLVYKKNVFIPKAEVLKLLLQGTLIFNLPP